VPIPWTNIFLYSTGAVAEVAVVCVAGAVLARAGILRGQTLADISKVLIVFALPCLLFARLVETVTPALLQRLWVLVAAPFFHVGLGFAVARVLMPLARPPAELHRGYVAALTFGNSGYLPMTLVSALVAATPQLRGVGSDAAGIGVAYVAVYLVFFAPLLWSLGYPYLLERPRGHLAWHQLVPPPVLGIVAGLVVGLTPLRGWFVGGTAPLHWLHEAASMVGWLTLPCAMLVLGGNLARGPCPHAVSRRALWIAGAGRLVLLPGIVLLLVAGLRRFGWLPDDPLLILVLILTAGTPTALNLLVMCQVKGQGERAMATVMFWLYGASAVTLAVLLGLALRVAGL
jgi:predicted permease